ncbi:MAG: TonB family protein [Myxococcaceae bacterium]
MSSVVGHVLLTLVTVVYLKATARVRPPPARPITMRTYDARQWELNRGGTVPAKPRARSTPVGQIVDVAPGNGQEAPDSKYVAKTSNRVQRETRAREQTNVYSQAAARTAPAPQALSAAKGKSSGRATPSAKAVGLADRFTGSGGARLSELLKHSTGAREEKNPESDETAGQDFGETQRPIGEDATLAGGGAPNDNLNNLPAGDGTYLNTREWQFASFFNRVKQAVSAKWDPNGRLRNHRGMFYERATVLVVTLRADGLLADCFVAKSSGMDTLDLEAVQAFERAQPFPNPPQALVSNGRLRFNFGFTVTHEPGGLPRMFH